MISIFHMSNYRYRALSVFICEIKGSILKWRFICEKLFHNKIHTWYQYFTYEISIYGKWIMWNFQFIYEITNFIYELKISYMNLRFHMWFDFIYGNFICEIAISHIKFKFHKWNFNFIYENFHFIYEIVCERRSKTVRILHVSAEGRSKSVLKECPSQCWRDQ